MEREAREETGDEPDLVARVVVTRLEQWQAHDRDGALLATADSLSELRRRTVHVVAASLRLGSLDQLAVVWEYRAPDGRTRTDEQLVSLADLGGDGARPTRLPWSQRRVDAYFEKRRPLRRG